MQVEIHNDGPVTLILERPHDSEPARPSPPPRRAAGSCWRCSASRFEWCRPTSPRSGGRSRRRWTTWSGWRGRRRWACAAGSCSAPTRPWSCGTRCWRSRRTRPTRSGCCGKLQGRTHQVVTSVALVAGERIHQATDVTNVSFRRLSDEFLARLRGDRRADGQGRGVRDPGLRRGAGGADRGRLLQRDGPADPAGARAAGARPGIALPVRGGRNGTATRVSEVRSALALAPVTR